MSKEIYEQMHVVAYALCHFVKEAIEILAALEAYETVLKNTDIPTPQNLFLQTAAESLRDDLIVKTAALYDKDKFGHKPNCSIAELETLINEDNKHDKVKKEELLKTIQNAKGIISFRDYRNKRKAHVDLESAFEKEVPFVTTEELKQLLFELRRIISLTFEYMFCVSLKSDNYEEIKEKYIESIDQCIRKASNT